MFSSVGPFPIPGRLRRGRCEGGSLGFRADEAADRDGDRARPALRLGSPAAAARCLHARRSPHTAARGEPLRHGRRRREGRPRRRPTRLQDGRRQLQRPRAAGDGDDRRPLRPQHPDRPHVSRGAAGTARAEPAPRQPQAAHARRVQARHDRERPRRRVAPVRGARLVQPRQEPARGAVRARARRRRPVGRAADADRAHAHRPVPGRERRAGDLGDHRLALVGRIADLRQRAGAHERAPRGCGRPDAARPGRPAAARPRREARPHRRRRQLLARARAPAHALHARAQRDRRPAGRRASATGRTTSCSRRRA